MVYWLMARALTTGPVHNAAALLVKDGFLHAFELFPRLPSLALLTLKARTPAPLKSVLQRALRQGGPYRPPYMETAL
jgi:hypothetical protein